jgi:topoisomerase IV subunit A
VQAADIPGGKGDGVPFTSLIELAPGARLAHVVDAAPGKQYLFANSGGYGFIAKAEDLLTRIRAGKAFMTVQEGEEVLRPALVSDRPEMAVTLSEHGRMLLFPAHELKELARGRGVTLMGLDDGEKMVAVGFADAKSVTILGRSRSGSGKTVRVSGDDLQKHIVHRARKGCLLPGKIVPLSVKS